METEIITETSVESTEKKKKGWKSELWQDSKQIDWDSYTDADLLAYYERAKEVPEMEVTDAASKKVIKLSRTQAYQEYLKTPFDYNQLRYELEKRGAKSGYYFEKNAATISAEQNPDQTIIDFTAERSIAGKIQVSITKETEEALAALKDELKKVGLDGKQAWGILNREIYARAVAEALKERQAGRLVFEAEKHVHTVERKRL